MFAVARATGWSLSELSRLPLGELAKYAELAKLAVQVRV